MNAVRSMIRLGALLLFGALVIGSAVSSSIGQEKGKGVVQAKATAEQASFDQPIAWMQEAKTNYGAVKDYACMLVSQERMNGRLGDQAMIQMKVMTQPFSVHMRWLAPQKDVGQEVLYVQGKNNGKMRVKSNFLGNKIVGFVSIDVNDPRVLQNSRHTITEAGIGHMIDETLKAWEIERTLGKTKVMPPLNAKYNQRDCVKIEVVRPEKAPQIPAAYRTVVYLEKQSKMPIRLENYDWPRKDGAPDGDLIEMFSYVNIQFNTGLREAEFNK